MRPRVLVLLVTLLLLPAGPVAGNPEVVSTPRPVCDRVPEPQRWLDAGEPDEGLDPPRVAVHRGAANLAPENTLAAIEYAVAYGMDLIEIDVQQTRDGRYVLFHDLDVDAKTDGSGFIPLMTYDELRQLNVADNDRWRGSAYDPSRMPSLEEALELGRKLDVGFYFDLKESVTNTFTIANLVAEHGVLERSIFAPYVPGRTEQILVAQPDAIVMHNNYADDAPPALLYAMGAEYDWFGGSLPNYNAERVAAIHDSCSLVLTNVYQGTVTGSEAGDLLYARGIGVDGVMVNNPDVAAATLGRPVATRIEVSEAAGRACLLGHLALGLPGKTLELGTEQVVTGRGGCADLPDGFTGEPIRFAGDGSAQPSSTGVLVMDLEPAAAPTAPQQTPAPQEPPEAAPEATPAPAPAEPAGAPLPATGGPTGLPLAAAVLLLLAAALARPPRTTEGGC